MPLGAIVKAGAKSLAKNQAKKIATDKLMGRGGKKGGASKETASNMVSGGISSSKKGRKPVAKTDGRRGYKGPSLEVVQAEIDAKETDKRIVKISKDVTAIAEAMKGGLVLKEKAQKKNRIAAEKEKRAAQESDIEKPDKPKKDGGFPPIKVPGVGLLEGIFGFITKFLYGVVILKLIEFLPKLKGLLGVLKVAGKVFNFIISGAGFILDALASFVDFGYKLVDGAERIVGKIFGEEGAKKFKTFMENLTNLINAFLVWKIIGRKIFTSVIKNIKNAFKLVKGFIRRGAQLVTKLFPQLGKFGTKLLTTGKGLVTKGLAKVGGFAAKIFGKASGVIAPAFKGAKPFLSKFFGKIPIVGPLVITIVSLLSGEPASQAIFKGLGAALGGALGTFIPIPILGTLIGETIGVFVGDLLYELLMGGGIDAVGQKLKDTFMTIFKGGKAVFNFFKKGFGNFISNFMEEHSINVPKALRFLIGGIEKIPNILQLYNPMVVAPLLIKSFFGKEESGGKDLKQEDAKIDDKQNNKNRTNADAVAEETTYESGEGNAVIVPIPIQQTQQVAIKNKRGRTIGYKTVVIDDSELAMYGGK